MKYFIFKKPTTVANLVLTHSINDVITRGGVRGGEGTGEEPRFGKSHELTSDEDRDLDRGVPDLDIYSSVGATENRSDNSLPV